MKSTFKVLFYLKKGSEKKNGEVMIMARITMTVNFASSAQNKAFCLIAGISQQEKPKVRMQVKSMLY